MKSSKATSTREEFIHQIGSWLSPPVFPDDEEKTRQAKILNLILINIIAIAPLLAISNLLGGNIPETVIMVDALAIILGSIVLYVLRRGRIKLAGIALVTLGLIGITLAIANLGTIRVPTTAMYLLMIITAGLLFDLRGMVVTTAVSSLMVGGLMAAENMALLPHPNYSVTITQWLTYAAIFWGAGNLTFSSLQSMNNALARADKELGERRATEAELAKHRDHLQELVRDGTAELEEKNAVLSEEIAERKMAEDALRIQKDLAERYLNIAEVIIVVLDTRARITLLNRKGHLVLGYKEGELIGKDWIRTCLRPQDHERVHEVNRKINAGETQAFEYYENYVLTKEGALRFIAWHTIILNDERGRIIGTLSSGEDITERKSAEKRIMESEEKYRQLVENSLMGIGISRGNQVIFANSALLSIFGYDSLEEFLKIPLMDHIAPESWEMIAARGQDLSSGKSVPSSFEYAIICKDGRTKVLRASSSQIILGDDTYTQTTFQDITEQKRMEKALQESENMYRAIFDNTGTATMIIEEDTTVSIANSELERLTGYSREEIEGKKSGTEFILKEDHQRMLALHKLRRIDPGAPLNSYEFRAVTKNGDVRDIMLRVGVIAGTKRSIASLLDITERKQMEEALRESEEKYRTIIEMADEGITIIQDGMLKYINPYLVKMWGGAFEDIIDTPFENYVHPDKRSEVIDRYIRRMRGEDVASVYETTLQRRDGTKVYIELRGGAITFCGKAADLVLIRDITERKHAEIMLKESLAEKELLLKEVHHRVKNNLQIISALLYLQSSNLADDNIRKIFRDSQNRIKSMALIHENLYKSKDLGNVDFNEYLKQLISHLSQSYGSFSQKIAIIANSDNVFLNINTAIPCGMIINELISNSLKHAFPDGRSGEICVDLSSEGDGYRLMVSDNGIGIKGNLNIKDSKTLGLRLIDTLIKQIGGKIRFDISNGTKCEIHFKGIK